MTILIKEVIISLVWISVWLHAYISGPKSPTLPKDKILTPLSSLVLFTITIFYFFSYQQIGSLPIQLSILTEVILIVGIIFFGGILMLSRHGLHELSYSDILFAKNKKRTQSGVYAYLQHPMYVGIVGIVLFSWGLFPTHAGIVCIFFLICLLCIKAFIE